MILNFNKKLFIIIILPLLLMSIDLMTKASYSSSELVVNRGFIFAWGEQINHNLILLMTSVLGLFFLFLYGILSYLFYRRSLVFLFSFALIIAGVGGNLVDRILHGHVSDYFSAIFFSFNFSDLWILLGGILLVSMLFKHGEMLWPDHEHRSLSIINRPFQFKIAFLLSLTSSLSVAIVFVYTYFFVLFIGINHKEALFSFLGMGIIITLIIFLITFSLGLLLSQKIVGPIFAFERFIKDLVDNKNPELHLRESDDFKYLEDLSILLKNKFKP